MQEDNCLSLKKDAKGSMLIRKLENWQFDPDSVKGESSAKEKPEQSWFP